MHYYNRNPSISPLHQHTRYEYDDHYFLTDPKEFIYEFFPLQPEWQLLKEPISLEEFEELPFVRSLFFRYQLAFPTQHMKSVMSTDQTGGQQAGVPASTHASILLYQYTTIPAYQLVQHTIIQAIHVYFLFIERSSTASTFLFGMFLETCVHLSI